MGDNENRFRERWERAPLMKREWRFRALGCHVVERTQRLLVCHLKAIAAISQ